MNKVKVDLKTITGEIKPMHGVCCAPYTVSARDKQSAVKQYFTEGNIPYCRLHDCCGGYGGSYFVDIPNIFRDFDADENDPASYDFYYTDEYIKSIEDSGCKTYYRLGVTIEHGSKKYTTLPPRDFEKWARICEHIVMHYNEGWADGFHYGIEYWEVWNEPENPVGRYGSAMWNGTKEQFFKLYEVTSKHLKARFPDIKIGGYGSCGFYTVTRTDENYLKTHKGYETFVPYFTDFLQMAKDKNCPLDFFSWHIYTGDEKELLAHAKFARETLDQYGFTDTEAHLNEWNIHAEGTRFLSKHTAEGASFDAAVMLMLQNTPYVDKAMYYCFSYISLYNGFLNQNDLTTDLPWYSFLSFGRLYALKNAVAVTVEGDIYAAAAARGDKAAVMLANYNGDDGETAINIDGISPGAKIEVRLISEQKQFEKLFSFTAGESTEISLELAPKTVALVEIG